MTLEAYISSDLCTDSPATIRHEKVGTVQELIYVPFFIEATVFVGDYICTTLTQFEAIFAYYFYPAAFPVVDMHYPAKFSLKLKLRLIFWLYLYFGLLLGLIIIALTLDHHLTLTLILRRFFFVFCHLLPCLF